MYPPLTEWHNKAEIQLSSKVAAIHIISGTGSGCWLTPFKMEAEEEQNKKRGLERKTFIISRVTLKIQRYRECLGQMGNSVTALSWAGTKRQGKEKVTQRALLLLDCHNNHPITWYLDSRPIDVAWMALSQEGEHRRTHASSTRHYRSAEECEMCPLHRLNYCMGEV